MLDREMVRLPDGVLAWVSGKQSLRRTWLLDLQRKHGLNEGGKEARGIEGGCLPRVWSGVLCCVIYFTDLALPGCKEMSLFPLVSVSLGDELGGSV